MTQRVDPFDELAALFLTEPDDNGDALVARSAWVELVIVGHLPVRANLWLTPYADAVAREAGPTVLLRLDEDQPGVQVMRACVPSVLAAGWSTLGDAVAQLAAESGRWVLRPIPDASPRELIEAGCDRITILSSADEVARVHAYTRVKALVEAAEQCELDLPALGLAILGADRQTAEQVWKKINDTTSTQLNVDLPLVVCLPQMDEAIRVTDCPPLPPDPAPSLPSLVAWIREATASAAKPTPAQTGRASGPDDGSTAPPLEIQDLTRELAPTAAPEWTPQSPPEPPEPPDAFAPRAPTVKIAPKPSVQVEPKEPSGVGEPDSEGAPVSLATYIEGVTPLAVRCPGHERLDLAVDGAGRLHVIAREAQMRELHVVAAWAKAHRELIAMACPQSWIDPAVKIVCHVFTEQPASVADLQGSDLRLHVLAPVAVEGRKGWYAAPLNAFVR
ncbi:MAG: hypothetical protein ACYS0G_05770 [Planctomycetota bacterium]|jgi:hypothetical protein